MGIRIITKNDGKPFRLWLPGVLIVFFLSLIFLLLLVPIVLCMIGLLIWNLIPGQGAMASAYTRIVFCIPKLLWAMRGLTVDIESKDVYVKIKF